MWVRARISALAGTSLKADVSASGDAFLCLFGNLHAGSLPVLAGAEGTTPGRCGGVFKGLSDKRGNVFQSN